MDFSKHKSLKAIRSLIKSLVFLALSSILLNCASFKNWGKRVNLTTGVGVPLNTASLSSSGINHMSDAITIIDGYGDSYTTSWEFKEKEPLNIPVALSLSLPVYWKDFNNGMDIETGIISKIYLPHGGVGPYVEGSVGPFSLNVSFGASIAAGTFHEVTTKPASYAWPGDPGIYSNGGFHAPSSFLATVDVDEHLIPGIFSSVSFKWHFIKWLYLEGGYSYYSKSETKITGISVDTNYTSEDNYEMNGSISLTGRNIIYLGVGIGF